MSGKEVDQERPCLHCMIFELIDDFFALQQPRQTKSTPLKQMK
jgi:hypothetical protein